MPEMMAYCGLVCTECEAYLATQQGSQEALEEVAAQWREQYNNPAITFMGIPCEGCLSEGRLCFHCAECGIRACAVERGVESCGHCPDYGCEKMAWILEAVPATKERLDAIHAGLSG